MYGRRGSEGPVSAGARDWQDPQFDFDGIEFAQGSSSIHVLLGHGLSQSSNALAGCPTVDRMNSICTGEGGQEGQYQLALETGDASNLSCTLSGLGFRSGEGVSPGRVLRVIHAIVRTIFLAMGTKKAELAHADVIIEKVSLQHW